MKIKLATRIGVVAAAVALALTGCSSGGGQPAKSSGSDTVDTVRVGYIGDYAGTSLVAIANKQNLWAKHGLKPELSVFTNGPLQVQALGTGDLDAGYIGPGAMWMPLSGQAKVLTVNGIGQADRVIAQPGISSIKDLKGKKVAVPEGTSGDMILSLALKKAGMSYKDVEKVAMDPSTVVSAFASKQVDAAGIWYPLIDTIKKQVPDLKELAKDSDFEKQVSFPSVIVAGNDFAKKSPRAAKKLLQVLRDASDWRAKHHDQSIAAVADMLKVDPSTVKGDADNVKVYTAAQLDAMTKDGTIDSWLKGMSDYFTDAGKITSAKPVDQVYDGTLFQSAGK